MGAYMLGSPCLQVALHFGKVKIGACANCYCLQGKVYLQDSHASLQATAQTDFPKKKKGGQTCERCKLYRKFDTPVWRCGRSIAQNQTEMRCSAPHRPLHVPPPCASP